MIVLEILWIQFWPFLTLISTYWPHTVPAASTCFSLARSPEKIKPWRRVIGDTVCFLPSKPPTEAVYTMSVENKMSFKLNVGGLPDAGRNNDPLPRRGRSAHAGLTWPIRIQKLFLSMSWRMSAKLIFQPFIRPRRNPTSLRKSSTPISRSDVCRRRRVDVW